MNNEANKNLSLDVITDAMSSSNLRELEFTLMTVLSSKRLDYLEQVCIEFVERCSSNLARDDVDSFVDLGFRLDTPATSPNALALGKDSGKIAIVRKIV